MDEKEQTTDAPRQAAEAAAPQYARHLLKVRVPVAVSLASKKLSIDELVSLQPGAMINFEKHCDGPLDLEVGSHRLAMGSVVKVGEKFGLEIMAMTLPDERFASIRPE